MILKKNLVSNHKFNEKKNIKSVIELIQSGKIISIISDAGTPILSDPGLVLLRECIKKNINIFPIPGVSAITTAISVSGFDDKYLFYGFLPKKIKDLEKVFDEINNYDFSIVFFIPAIKINFYLKYFKIFFKDRSIFIGREMTKIHETFYRGSIDNFKNFESSTKGELTVVLSKKNLKKNNHFSVDERKLNKEISSYLKRYTLKDVVKLVSEKNNLPKKMIYNLCLKIKKK